jgi:hypothetical protein
MKIRIRSFMAATLFAALALFGCGKAENPVQQDFSLPSHEAPTAAPAAIAPAAPAAVPAAADGPAPTATVEGGVVTLLNGTGHPVSRDICYFKEGPHPQELLLVKEIKAVPGATSTLSFPNDALAEKLGLTEAECSASGEVQVDVVKTGRCEQGSANLGPSLIAFERHVPVSFERPAEPAGEEVLIDTSDWETIACEDVPEGTQFVKNCKKTEICKCKVQTLTFEQKFTCAASSSTRTEKRYKKKCQTVHAEDICHTEKPRYCYTREGEEYCSKDNAWYKQKKWQCQNVPPLTPGHLNHFQHTQHADFHGKCNTRKCYEIRN